MRIEVTVRDDKGKVLSEQWAKDTQPGKPFVTVTAMKYSDGSVSVTDDQDNTYYEEPNEFSKISTRDLALALQNDPEDDLYQLPYLNL